MSEPYAPRGAAAWQVELAPSARPLHEVRAVSAALLLTVGVAHPGEGWAELHSFEQLSRQAARRGEGLPLERAECEALLAEARASLRQRGFVVRSALDSTCLELPRTVGAGTLLFAVLALMITLAGALAWYLARYR